MWMCIMEITCNVILTCLFPTSRTLFFSEIKSKSVHSVNKQEIKVLQKNKTSIFITEIYGNISITKASYIQTPTKTEYPHII